MISHYAVSKGAGGWLVTEDDDTISTCDSKSGAIALARTLTLAIKAVGGMASLSIEGDDGKARPVNPDFL